jgi:hypothetical protein
VSTFWLDSLGSTSSESSSVIYGRSRLHGYIDSKAQSDAGWAIAFLFISILEVDIFRRAGDIPVMIIFVGLTLIFATKFLLACSPEVRCLPCRSLPICHRNLAYVLHVHHGNGHLHRCQSMSLNGAKRGCRRSLAGGDRLWSR